MKTVIIRMLVLAVFLSIVVGVNAQTTKKTTTKTQTTKSNVAKPSSSAKIAPVEVTIKLTSKCEKNVMMFAGPKENLRDPKMKEFGGLSVNTLYVKTGNVVCVMDAKKKPVSCVSITKGTTLLEINSSGTAIVAK